MTEILFRKAQAGDVGILVKLRVAQLQEEGAEATFDLTPALFDYYSAHLADNTFISWVAVDGTEVIAASGLSFIHKPPYYANPTGKIGLVSNMYTRKEYRRRGIARTLLGKVVEEAAQHGCTVVQVTASHEGVFLYTNFGFTKNTNFLQYACG